MSNSNNGLINDYADTQSSTPYRNENLQDLTHAPDVHDNSMVSQNSFAAVGQYGLQYAEDIDMRRRSSRTTGSAPRPASRNGRQTLAGCKRKRLDNLPLESSDKQPTGEYGGFRVNDQISLDKEPRQDQSYNMSNLSSQPYHSSQGARGSKDRHAEVIELSDDEVPALSTKRQRVDKKFTGPYRSSGYQAISPRAPAPRPQIHPSIRRTYASPSHSVYQNPGLRNQPHRRQVTPNNANGGFTSSSNHPQLNQQSSRGRGQFDQPMAKNPTPDGQANASRDTHAAQPPVSATKLAPIEKDTRYPEQVRTSPSYGTQGYRSDTDSRGIYPYRAEEYQSGLPSKLRSSHPSRAEGNHANVPSNSPYESDRFLHDNSHQNLYKHPNNARASLHGKEPASRQPKPGLRNPLPSPRQSKTLLSVHNKPQPTEPPSVAASKRKRPAVIEVLDSESEGLPTAAKRQRSLSPSATFEYPQATPPNQHTMSSWTHRQVLGTTNTPGHISRSVRNTTGAVPRSRRLQGNRGFPEKGRFCENGVFQEDGGSYENGELQQPKVIRGRENFQDNGEIQGNMGFQGQGGLNHDYMVAEDDGKQMWEATIGSTTASGNLQQASQPYINTTNRAKVLPRGNLIAQANAPSRFNPQSQAKPPSGVNTPPSKVVSQARAPEFINTPPNTGTPNITKRRQSSHTVPFTGAPKGYKLAPYNRLGYAHDQSLSGPPIPSSNQSSTPHQLPSSSQYQQNQQHYEPGYPYPQGTSYQHQADTATPRPVPDSHHGCQDRNQVNPYEIGYRTQDFPPVSNPSPFTSSVVNQSDAESPVVVSHLIAAHVVTPSVSSPPVVTRGVFNPPVIQSDVIEAGANISNNPKEPDHIYSPPASPLANSPPKATESVDIPPVTTEIVVNSTTVTSRVVAPPVAESIVEEEPSAASPLVDPSLVSEPPKIDQAFEAASDDHAVQTTEFVPWCEDDLRYVIPYLEEEKVEIFEALKFTRDHYSSILGEEPPQTSRDLSYATQWGEMQAALADRWLGPGPVPYLFSLEPWNRRFSSWWHPQIEEVNGRSLFCNYRGTGMDLSDDAFRYYGDPYESELARHLQEGVGSRKPIKDPWGLWGHVSNYSYLDRILPGIFDVGDDEELPADHEGFHGFVETESLHSDLGDEGAMAASENKSLPHQGQNEGSHTRS